METIINTSISSYEPLRGGDISEVFLLKTSSHNLVIKINDVKAFPSLFDKEKEGLEAIKASNTIRVPEVIKTGAFNNYAFIILEYLEQKKSQLSFWEAFGEQLARMHRTTHSRFGFKSSNYIGSLFQQNNYCDTAISFYLSQRLIPQFELAVTKGFQFKNKEVFFKELEHLIPLESPSLIHGDLWSGNYLITTNSTPCLIDPSVSFFHREMDIAMMHLFGGFSPMLFESYNHYFPLQDDWQKRLDIWQIYYLLVHLNIFGSSYYRSVDVIIKKYT
ncbi:phosphotransferase [Flavobacteriaceae bacterium R38]|nr:phosphotransferase [Flavobacteriaceae bacterium R38]